jgi:cytochrome b subunit of formate dehydrogenase
MRKKLNNIHALETGAKRIMRFSPLNRALHIAMVISFLNLAITGMLLKFSYTPLARSLVTLYGGGETAGIIHRIAASLLILVFIIHVVDLVRKKNKKYGSFKNLVFGPESMMFNRKDLHDFIGSLKWFVGYGKRPEYGRWTYWEKFDYFAVFWGIFVIGFTGLTLWFPEFFTNVIPGSLLNIATIVHSDEALLAAGFIFTVHFFNTHFRPEKFPMDTVVFTGSYTLDEFKYDRPLEYKRLVETGDLDKLIVQPPSRAYEIFVKIFGWAALITGISIVIFIIYSMLFFYK